MKKTVLTLVLSLILLSLFALPEEVKDSTAKSSKYATFSDMKQITGVVSLYEFLKEFVSWKNWRYWIAVIITSIVWFVFSLVHGTVIELFPEETKEKIVKREGLYYIFWIGYTFIIALFFSFGYKHLINFASDFSLLSIPRGQHWISWVLWSGLVFLCVSAVWAVIRELIVFKHIALYTIPYQIIHGLVAMPLIFIATTAVTYFAIAVGLVLGGIIILVVGLTIITFILKSTDGPLSGSPTDDDDYNRKVKQMNAESKRRNEEYNRKRDRAEKFNREKMKEHRGW